MAAEKIRRVPHTFVGFECVGALDQLEATSLRLVTAQVCRAPGDSPLWVVSHGHCDEPVCFIGII